MDGQDEGPGKLSPGDLVDLSKYAGLAQAQVGGDQDNYFTCLICYKVLSEPKECS